MSPHNKNYAKQDHVYKKEHKLKWLDETTFVNISLASTIAIVFGLAVFSLVREGGCFANRAEVRGTDAVVVPQGEHKLDDAADRKNRTNDNQQEQTRGQWKPIIAYEDSAGRDDDGMGGGGGVPKKMRTGKLSVLMPPLLFSAPGKDFSGWFLLFGSFAGHESKLPAKMVNPSK